jgi:tetratricopeptide (TPR) repeat protein
MGRFADSLKNYDAALAKFMSHGALHFDKSLVEFKDYYAKQNDKLADMYRDMENLNQKIKKYEKSIKQDPQFREGDAKTHSPKRIEENGQNLTARSQEAYTPKQDESEIFKESAAPLCEVSSAAAFAPDSGLFESSKTKTVETAAVSPDNAPENEKEPEPEHDGAQDTAAKAEGGALKDNLKNDAAAESAAELLTDSVLKNKNEPDNKEQETPEKTFVGENIKSGEIQTALKLKRAGDISPSNGSQKSEVLSGLMAKLNSLDDILRKNKESAAKEEEKEKNSAACADTSLRRA